MSTTTDTTDATRAGTVLIVDDTEHGRESLAGALLSEGYAIEFADSGSAALAAVANRIPDAILLDIMMPDMDGFEVCRRLRAEQRFVDLPILMVTALEGRESRVRGLRAGADDFVSKPFDRIELRARLKTAVRLSRMRRQLAERAALDARVEAEARLLSHVSHEVRTPLSVIRQFVSVLLEGVAGKISAEQKLYLEIMSRNVGQLERMIGDLLETSRARNGGFRIEPHWIDAKAVLADTVEAFRLAASNQGVKLGLHLGGTLRPVHADPQRFFQIASNLIDNAIKHTPKGGEVRVTAGEFPDDPDWLRVEVSDTGTGIDGEDAEHVFEHLYQGSRQYQKGLGLGLFISRQLVKAHGGEIWFEKRSEGGTRFAFTLPLFQVVSRAGEPAKDTWNEVEPCLLDLPSSSSKTTETISAACH